MKNQIKGIIFYIISIHYCVISSGQCPGGIQWKNGTSSGGTLRDTGIALVNDTVFLHTTTPTLGSFASGRPGYLVQSTTWAGYLFEAIGLFRGGGLGATTRFVFKIPLDSNHIHFRISDVRGDGFNTEHQSIRGYRNGLLIPASFKDPVNNVTIASGNEVRGAGTTTSTIQSATRIFFNQSVDSVIIASIGFSDYVIIELYARCDIVLAGRDIRLFSSIAGNSIRLNWNNPHSEGSQTPGIERSSDGINWAIIGEAGKDRYDFTDNHPNEGMNYYRIKYKKESHPPFYSTIASVQYRSKEETNNPLVHPNPFADHIYVAGAKNYRVFIFDANGRRISGLPVIPSSYGKKINTEQLSPGIYFLYIDSVDGTINKKKIIKY
jgi:hypothetical protein